jgi:hypothetical protein
VARRAGLHAETTAVPTPTASASATVRGRMRTAPVAPVRSTIASSADRTTPPSAQASKMPNTRPAAPASAPRTADSIRTERRSWPRLAPTQRSSASSLVREARMIEKVLRIRNVPVNNATTPAARKKMVLPPSLGVALRARSASRAVSVNAW